MVRDPFKFLNKRLHPTLIHRNLLQRIRSLATSTETWPASAWFRWVAGGILLPVLGFLLLHQLFPLPATEAYSHVVLDNRGRVLHGFLNPSDKWRMQVELHEIHPDIRTAFLAKEDRWFYWHPGVNPMAIVRALWVNTVSGRRTSGASTITMQVARLMEPRPRTHLSKIIEMFRALQLEYAYSKDEILQLYLNRIPYGGNIEGIKSASILYFDRLPEQLSLAQIVTLTIIPNRPNQLQMGQHNERLTQERNRWIQRFKQQGIFETKRCEDALTESLNYRRREMPRLAPHFAQRLRQRHKERYNLHSSIDYETQAKAEQLVASAHRRLRLRNIRHLAAIVIDNRTMQVKAYVGSPDFFDQGNEGQVDGVRAVRSPGSTLKPLLYALALDQGLLTPLTKINDVPITVDGYRPENYDTKFNGPITSEDALAYSLNIPAVKVLQRVGTPTVIDKLTLMNFRQIAADRNKLGLSMALGGCGTRLEELAGMYAMLANQGTYHPLNWLKEDTTSTEVRIISPASAYLITESLTRLTRPDLPNNREQVLHIPKIAWKTGTSYGRRDAWSIGYNKNYTIAVWAGNFDNTGVADLSGAEIATPVLFSLFNTIDYSATNQWYKRPKNVQDRLVCPVSGLPKGPYCTHEVVDTYIREVTSTLECRHLKEVAVSLDERISYCKSCQPPEGFKKVLYPNYDPEVILWMDQMGIRYQAIPPHASFCTRVEEDQALRILHPIADKEYLFERGDPHELQLVAEASPDVEQLYWYLNHTLVARTIPGEAVFIKVAPGQHQLSCSDNRGRNVSIPFRVRSY